MKIDIDDALVLLGGRIHVRPDAWPEDPEGWRGYLCTVVNGKLRHFEAGEFITPASGGMSLPPRALWPNLALCALAADEYREQAGVPVRVRYGYRDVVLNTQVHGAPRSDHLTASAVDLQCLGDRAKAGTARARDRWTEALWRLPGLGVSIGEGATITHLGLLSPAGRRRWKY